MSIGINTNTEYILNSLRKKPSFRRDGSYRIFHITRKQKEDSDDDDIDDNSHLKIEQTNEIKPKSQKKSFKISNRNGLDGWKRKSTKNKRLLFLQKTLSESTSNEIKSPPLTNDLSSSIISNDAASKKNKQNDHNESLESDTLVEAIEETITHDDATLNDLLARADKLETTFKKQDFNKIQPLSRTSIHQRRKRFIIAFSTVFIALIIILTIIICVVVMKLKYKTHNNQISGSTSIYDPH